VNLARFGLTRDDHDEVVEDGSVELVEITQREAEADCRGVEVIEIPQAERYGRKFLTVDLDHVEYETDFHRIAQSQSKKKTKKYVRRKKNTSKRFIDRMKGKYGLLDLDKPIRDMKEDELLAHFREPETKAEKKAREKEQEEKKKRKRRLPKKKKREKYKGPFIDKRKFALNVIWQVYRQIQAKEPPEFVKVSCNIRSFYYYVKTIIRDNSRIFGEGDVYDDFTDGMQAIVLDGLVSYKDFNVLDDRRTYRLLPPNYGNTHIILLAEKDSFVGRFFELGSRYGVVVQITKGRGSVLMADSLLTEMYEAGYDMNKQLSILSFCDFDPVGTSVPYHFSRHLRTLGFKNIRDFAQYGSETKTFKHENGSRKTVTQIRPCLDIVNPHELGTSVRNSLRHAMPPSTQDNPSTEHWAFITTGVTGTTRNTKYAISSEMLLPFLEAQLEEKITPLLEKPAEAFGRKLAYDYLRDAILKYTGVRVQHGLWDKA
jgi:hypothetical protein